MLPVWCDSVPAAPECCVPRQHPASHHQLVYSRSPLQSARCSHNQQRACSGPRSDLLRHPAILPVHLRAAERLGPVQPALDDTRQLLRSDLRPMHRPVHRHPSQLPVHLRSAEGLGSVRPALDGRLLLADLRPVQLSMHRHSSQLPVHLRSAERLGPVRPALDGWLLRPLLRTLRH